MELLRSVLKNLPEFQELTAALEGVAMAVWPIGIIVIAAIFVYNLSVKTGGMDTIKTTLTAISADRRIQVLIIAWGFGGFLEGASGFGTSVAIPAAILALALGALVDLLQRHVVPRGLRKGRAGK